MIVSKSNKGFTLIEVLIALAIVGMALTPLLLNQSSLILRVAENARKIKRIFAAENFMVTSFIEFEKDPQKKKNVKKIEEPEIQLSYRIAKPSEKIKKEFKDIYTTNVTTEWKEQEKAQKEKLVNFLFLPELKKDD